MIYKPFNEEELKKAIQDAMKEADKKFPHKIYGKEANKIIDRLVWEYLSTRTK